MTLEVKIALLIDALRSVLACAELNQDDLEEDTREYISFAQLVLEAMK